MIIGRALGKLFDGLTITVDSNVIEIQNNYGNQDALNKFIAESDKNIQLKFPLIFYVIAENRILSNFRYCDTDLIIMMNTEEYFLYKDRTDEIYIKYIEPIYNLVVDKLKKNTFITDLSEKIDKYSFVDVPNYGIRDTTLNTSINPVAQSQNNSAVTDYVDARIIKLRLRINTNCLT